MYEYSEVSRSMENGLYRLFEYSVPKNASMVNELRADTKVSLDLGGNRCERK